MLEAFNFKLIYSNVILGNFILTNIKSSTNKPFGMIFDCIKRIFITHKNDP
jgi:hypothetical protein